MASNVTSVTFKTFIPQAKALAEKTAEQVKQEFSEITSTQKDEFQLSLKTIKEKLEGLKTEGATEAEKGKNTDEKKNIFRRGWNGIKSFFNTILKPFKSLYNKLFKPSEKEAKTVETQTEPQSQTNTTATTKNASTSTETQPPADTKDSSAQAQPAA